MYCVYKQQKLEPTTLARVKQMTLKESREQVQTVWDINAQAHHIHRWIREVITIDCQPFSIVQDMELTRLLNTLEPSCSLWN